MVLKKRGDCSLILARVYGGEREKRRREEEEGKRGDEEDPGLEHLFCMEFMFETPLLLGTLGFVG